MRCNITFVHFDDDDNDGDDDDGDNGDADGIATSSSLMTAGLYTSLVVIITSHMTIILRS